MRRKVGTALTVWDWRAHVTPAQLAEVASCDAHIEQLTIEIERAIQPLVDERQRAVRRRERIVKAGSQLARRGAAKPKCDNP